MATWLSECSLQVVGELDGVPVEGTLEFEGLIAHLMLDGPLSGDHIVVGLGVGDGGGSSRGWGSGVLEEAKVGFDEQGLGLGHADPLSEHQEGTSDNDWLHSLRVPQLGGGEGVGVR